MMWQHPLRRRGIPINWIERIPEFVTSRPHESRSDKYDVIPTIEVIHSLAAQGWNPVEVQVQDARNKDLVGFQKHMCRLSHPEFLTREQSVDILIINSHNGRTSYQIKAGVFRFVCCNGLVVGDEFFDKRIRHINLSPEDVLTAATAISEVAQEVPIRIDTFKSIRLTATEQYVFSTSAAEMLYPAHVRPYPKELAQTRRLEDRESLWGVYNSIQENWSKGQTYYRDIEGTKRKNKKPTSIDKQVKLNQALWALTERMAQIKESDSS